MHLEEAYQLNIKKNQFQIQFFKNSLIDFSKGDKFKFELDKFNLNKEILIEKNIYNHSYRFFKYFLEFLPKFFLVYFQSQSKYEIEKLLLEEKTFEYKVFKESLKKILKHLIFQDTGKILNILKIV